MHTRVVGLAEGAEQAGSGRRANETSILLLPEVRPCGACALVCSIDVHLIDEVPIRLLHVLEADIAQNTRIVDQDIDATEVVDGSLDNVLAILNRIVVGNSLSALRLDLVDNGIRRLFQLS
jgi:hypothetical protein